MTIRSQSGSATLRQFVKGVEEIENRAGTADVLRDRQIRLIGSVIGRAEIGDRQFRMVLLHDPGERLLVGKSVALNIGVPEKQNAGLLGGDGLAIGRGAAALAPIGVVERAVALGVHHVELAFEVFPSQIQVWGVLGIVTRDVERLPPAWIAAKP